MKIAFLNIYSGINNRGAEIFIHELAARLGKKNEVEIIKAEPHTWVVQPENTTSILKRFFLDSASISVLIFTIKILPKLWANKFDILIPVNGFWQVLLCKIMTLFRGGKVVITSHSGPFWDERWNLYLKPDAFVATTEPTANWAKKTSPWTRVIPIPYGIDLAKFARVPLAKLKLKKPIILCPAAAVQYKRVDLAIKAVSKINNVSLLHLGSGPEIDKLNAIGKALLSDRHQSISVQADEMPKYYAACDLVTLPSASQENSPMVFLEAMAAHKFVVATDAPRPRWMLGPAGVFVDPENIEEYANALKIALEKKWGKEQQDQLEKFSWDKIVTQYENLFNELTTK